MTRSDQLVLQLDQTMRILTGVLAHQATVARANLQQVYSMDELQTRYALSRAQVVALLERHCGYVGKRGNSPRIHLDDVLRIDQALARRTTST